jgi:tyrosyl-tRNA synthetase
LEEIAQYEVLHGAELNKVKVLLADEATKLLHGENCLKQIHDTTANIFGRTGSEDLDSLPVIQLDEFSCNAALVEVLVKAAMVSSKNEGRRLIKAGGVKLNDVKVEDEHITIHSNMADSRGRIKISTGKKKHAVVQMPNI